MSDHDDKPSLVHEILDRRVLQILGLYLGASWGVIQFVQWLMERYELSPQLDHVAFVTLLSLVPSILIVSWFHGKAGRQGGWTRLEKVGIPVNLGVTVVLLLVTVRGGSAGAATQAVTVTDEEGNRVERVVPKQEFRRAVLLFGLENRSGDPELDWLEDGITGAAAFDLVQDPFVEAAVPFNFDNLVARLRREGFPTGAGMPLALQREIAGDANFGHFGSGYFSGREEELSVTLTVYETESGQAVDVYETAGTDLFTVADELSRRIKLGLGVPAEEIAEAQDLPARELLTSIPEAYEALIRGMRAVAYDEDLARGRRFAEEAVALDESFTMAHFARSTTCMMLNDTACARESVEAAMRHAYRLPESLRFDIKSHYYLLEGDQGKRIALLKMRAEMLPDDVGAQVRLGRAYTNLNRWPEAIAAWERALELAPRLNWLYPVIGRAWIESGEPEKARRYYETYAARVPDAADSYAKLGWFYENVADYENARSQYEKGLLLEPGDVALLRDLGDAERQLGRWEAARQRYEEALAASREPLDLTLAHRRLDAYYQDRGRLAEALRHLELHLEHYDTYASRLDSAIQRLFNAHRYAQVGDEARAREVVRAAEEELEPPFDRLAEVGYLLVDAELGDVAAAEERFDELDRVVDEMSDVLGSMPVFRPEITAKVLETKEDFEGALARYRQGLELRPTATHLWIGVLRCERRLGRLGEAAATRDELLRLRSHDPRALLEAALVESAAGDTERAVEHLEEALAVWAEADPDFEPAREARQELERLTGS